MTLIIICSIILGFLVSWRVVLQIRQWALATQHLDIPNERSSHYVPTPKGGGLAIASTSLTLFVLSVLFYSKTFANNYLVYVLAASLISYMGWVDDQRSLPIKARLLAQTLIAIAFIAIVDPVTNIELPGYTLIIVPTVAFGVGVIWMVGLTNTYNFMDGIDGIAGTQAVTAGAGWCFLLLVENQHGLALLSVLVAATSFGFLRLNLAPALIFMGDVGSTFLGFTFAGIPILGFAQFGNDKLLCTGAIFVLPFLFDSFFTIIRRAINGENILRSHRSHLYQRLVIKGYSHAAVTKLYGGLASLSAVCGIIYYFGSPMMMLFALSISVAQCILLVMAVSNVERREVTKVKLEKQREIFS